MDTLTETITKVAALTNSPILFHVDKGSVYVGGKSDLNTVIGMTVLPSHLKYTQGNFLLPKDAALILANDILQREEDISFTFDEGQMLVKQGKTKLKLNVAVDEMMTLKELNRHSTKEYALTLSATELKTALGAVQHFFRSDMVLDMRMRVPTLIFKKDKSYMIGTNGFAMSVTDVHPDSVDTEITFMPNTSFDSLPKIMLNKIQVSISDQGNHATFYTESNDGHTKYKVIHSLVAGDPLDFFGILARIRPMLPSYIELDRKELLRVMNMLSYFVQGNEPTKKKVTLNFQKSGVRLSASGPNGDSDAFVPAEPSGVGDYNSSVVDDAEINLNPDIFKNVLDSCKTDKLLVWFRDKDVHVLVEGGQTVHLIPSLKW